MRALAVVAGLFLLIVLPETAKAATPSEILILYNADDRNVPLPPCDECPRMDVNAPQSLPHPPRAVIATGHAEHGRYLGLLTEDFVWTLRALNSSMEWLVIDACLSAQADLLIRLEEAGVDVPVVIGTSTPIPSSGIEYEHLFELGGEIDARELGRLRCCGGVNRPLTRVEGRGRSRELRGVARDARARARNCALSEGLVQTLPNLYPSRTNVSDGAVLVVIAPEDWPAGCEVRR